nr:MAG TPA: SAP domain [Caudoviricetes sp.]
MTVAQINILAAELGYSISGKTKTELITSFLAKQGA